MREIRGSGFGGAWLSGKLKNPSKWGFTAEPGGSKDGFDEPHGFISGKEPFGYHPEMGGYPDLYNHLLGLLKMSRLFIKVFLVALVVQMVIFFPCWLFIGSEWTGPIRTLAFWFYLPAGFIAGPLARLIAGAFENGLMLAMTMAPLIGGLLYSCGIGFLAVGLARHAAKRQIRP